MVTPRRIGVSDRHKRKPIVCTHIQSQPKVSLRLTLLPKVSFDQLYPGWHCEVKLLVCDLHVLLLLVKAIFGHRAIHLMHLDADYPAIRTDLDKNLADPICQTLGHTPQHNVSWNQRRLIGSKGKTLQLLLQSRLAQKKGQWRPQIVQFTNRSLPHLLVVRQIEPPVLAVAQEQLLSRRTVLPPHLARFFSHRVPVSTLSAPAPR